MLGLLPKCKCSNYARRPSIHTIFIMLRWGGDTLALSSLCTRRMVCLSDSDTPHCLAEGLSRYIHIVLSGNDLHFPTQDDWVEKNIFQKHVFDYPPEGRRVEYRRLGKFLLQYFPLVKR